MLRPKGTLAILIAAVFVMPACKGLRNEPPVPSAPQVFAPADTTPATTVAPATSAPNQPTSAKNGTFVITLRDQNGRGAENIPLDIVGPTSRTHSSDASGRVRFSGPEGEYSFSVSPGCTERLIVLKGGSGSGYLVGGQEGRGEIAIGWQHRISPGKYTASSVVGDWPVGKDVDLRYDVVDRCENDRGIQTSFSTFQVEPSSTIEVVGTPSFASDGDGHAFMRVRCKGQGGAAVVLFDGKNPPDRMDLLDYIFEGRPSCS